jgi:hypothetical protein
MSDILFLALSLELVALWKINNLGNPPISMVRHEKLQQKMLPVSMVGLRRVSRARPGTLKKTPQFL